MFPILVSRAPHFKETLDWLHFAYTADSTGSYMEPSSTVLVLSVLLKGDPLFPAFWRHVMCRFLGAYAPTPTMCDPLEPDYLGYPEVVPTPTTLGPLVNDYFDGSPRNRAPDRRDRSGGKEGGDKHRNTNI